MHEIKCPKCGTTIKIDETSYAEVLKQVHNTEFERELAVRMKEMAKINQKNLELAKQQIINDYEQRAAHREQEIQKLQNKLSSFEDSKQAALAQMQNQLDRVEADKQAIIAKMQGQLDNAEAVKELAVAEAVSQNEHRINEYEQNITELKNKLKDVETAKQLAITEIQGQLKSAETEKQLAVTEATAKLEREIDGYKKDLENIKTQTDKKELMLVQNYEQQLRDRDEVIDRLKELKTKLSTKMIGETLEQHCQNEFNGIRATAFPHAVFNKDNVVSATGSKGDYIFRDYDANGNEIVSIMFEMKNENDTTATKHKNEDFLKELDKDRKEKNCEYAVLVSLLESESELYNRGIVDVSYIYPKMYVIRPQFFLPLIGIITNTAKNALEYKTELALVKNQNLDITNFESKLNSFKNSFAINSERATNNFNKAIDEIDKSIDRLQKTKAALLLTVQNFNTANRKLDDLTVKRLTHGNATMTKLFKDAGAATE